MNRRRGSVALFTLWMIMFMAILCTGLAAGARQKALIFQRLTARDRVWAMNEAAGKRILGEIRADGPAAADIATGQEWYYSRLGIEESLAFENGTATVVITDENGRINVNKANNHLLTNIITVTAGVDTFVAGRLANAIIDFRDSDDYVSGDDGDQSGSEAGNYRYFNSRPKNQDYEFVEELLLVDGMTLEIYDRLKDHVTVYGDGRVNINTCGVEELMTLDFPSSLVRIILAYREGDDGNPGTGDDGLFTEPGRIMTTLEPYDLSPEDRAALNHALSRNEIGVTSTHFRVTGHSRLSKTGGEGSFTMVAGSGDGVVHWAAT